MVKEELLYQEYYITFQEVPDEISLCVNIAGCPHRCKGCHSPSLREYIGSPLSEDIDIILNKYIKAGANNKNYISCVCFMGGDQNEKELINICRKIKGLGLKTCLYTGSDSVSESIIEFLDYLKVGEYVESLGGLNKETTNQTFFKINKTEKGYDLEDITYRFQKRYV